MSGLVYDKKPVSRLQRGEGSPEGQEPADSHVNGGVFVPGLGGDLASDVPRTARSLKAARSVLPHDASDDGEREADEHPRSQEQEHRGGWEGLGGTAEPVDRVHHAPRQEQRSWRRRGRPSFLSRRHTYDNVPALTREEGRGEDNVPHPALAVDLGVEAAGDVS